MKIKQLINYWFRCRHGSVSLGLSFWSVTACNGYGIDTEQKCLKCGAYRHRLIKLGCDSSEEWRGGRLLENTRQPKYTRLNIEPLKCATCGAEYLYYDGYHCPNGCETKQKRDSL